MIPFVTINLDKPRKLRFGLSASVELEQITGKKLSEMGNQLSVTQCSLVLWIMLKQDDPSLTQAQVNNLVDEYAKDMNYVLATVGSAIQAAYPAIDPEKNAPNPAQLRVKK